ncbi:MAG: FtsQ-type POTRA domain-containing protein [Proteobacteria bacterium]|nr:FtsQ-type POTRA domain-containing protein [Pseudomonadota bacterium]
MKLKSKNRHKRSFSQHFKLWLKPLLVFFLIASIGWSLVYYNPSELLKTRVSWEIDRSDLVNKTTLEAQIKPLIQGAYQLDLHQIKQRLEQHPWVQNAQVKRLFWDAINIHITTHKIAAHWEDIACNQSATLKKCQGYVTTQGVLITPDHLFFKPNSQTSEPLVLLKSNNNPEKSSTLLKDYQAYQAILADMKIHSLVRSNIDHLIIKPNMTVVLGYNNQQQRLKNFVKIYQKLRRKISLKRLHKATYNMRYPKGFTLKY